MFFHLLFFSAAKADSFLTFLGFAPEVYILPLFLRVVLWAFLDLFGFTVFSVVLIVLFNVFFEVLCGLVVFMTYYIRVYHLV